MVIIAEIIVDWLKHAFITRFNEIPSNIYQEFTISLAYDLAQTKQKHVSQGFCTFAVSVVILCVEKAFTDHSDLVARRMGFIPLPLGVLATRIISQAVEIPNWGGGLILILAFMCLVSFRILSNIITLGKACDLIDTHQKQRAAAHATSASGGTASSAATCTSPRASRPEKRINNAEETESNSDSPLPPVFVRSMSIDVSQLSTSPEKMSNAAKIRSVSHSPPRITRRAFPQHRKRASASPQIPPLIPELGCQPIFSNSTVSLNSICLNEEVLKEESPERSPTDDKQMTNRTDNKEPFPNS